MSQHRKPARTSGKNISVFSEIDTLREQLAAANVDPRSIAAQIDDMSRRFPNAAVNDDERRRLRGMLYAPLLALPQDDQTRIVDLIIRSLLP